jgi:hypothetical protein
VSPAGQGFVLYQTPKREVTAVAVSKTGAIFAACVGNKSFTPSLSAPQPTLPALPAPGSPGVVTLAPAGAPHSSGPPVSFGAPAAPIAGGSEVYRIDPDGSPRKVWSNAEDTVYAVAFDGKGKPVLGTGNRGRIYRLDSDTLWTLLLDSPPTQVTGFASGTRGQFYAVTGNIGKAYEIGPGMAKSGDFESDALDAGAFSYWGRLSFRGVPEGVSVQTRSGNLNRPQNNWSPWAPLTNDSGDGEGCPVCGGGRIASPAARFLQYKAELSASSARGEPGISSVEVAYLPKNAAPVIEEIEITPPNYRFPASLLTMTPSTSITLPAIGAHKKEAASSLLESSSSQSMNYAKGFLGVRWAAADENGDSLIYKVEIRGVKDSDWLPVKDKIKDKYLSWDSTEFPDGEYVVRVTASDAPDNPPDQALSASLESDPFLIDNTPPQILNLTAAPSGNKIEARWRAHDAASNIDRAEYSVNGGDWMLVEPVTKLSDSRNEEYRLVLERAMPGEQVIAVRVTDEYDNQAVEKIVVRR